MYRRDGCWVAGHYRNNSWVEGHYRSGSTVHGYIPELDIKGAAAKSSANKLHAALMHGSITFKTDCWWCGDEVYFHRDESGGSVLFDKLGPPWPIHPCWDKYSEYRHLAIEQALARQSEAISGQENIKAKEIVGEQKALVIEGMLLGYLPTVRISLKNESEYMGYVSDVVVDFAGELYRIYVEERVRELTYRCSIVRFSCSVTKRGSGYVLFAEAAGPLYPVHDVAEVRASISGRTLCASNWVRRLLQPRQ
ncbi:hypothetical protein [Marinobacter xestospongiae]|uniref:PRC-barrel domain-containing protein n=1 Tax=Marinobacter xestospongiae TaxID=994319 RepID=A0ABU3W3H2_9GAMM|nr:hypothetical protein [Marinobacter xestospongiae]MDV2081078.1 hypothetical protein [Marinobacter xestospongiae]